MENVFSFCFSVVVLPVACLVEAVDPGGPGGLVVSIGVEPAGPVVPVFPVGPVGSDGPVCSGVETVDPVFPVPVVPAYSVSHTIISLFFVCSFLPIVKSPKREF